MSAVVLDRCLNILKTSKSDNELLAALLMVTKVTKAEDCDGERMKDIFDAVGFKFLSRLLRTGDKSSTDGTTRNAFKSIAVNIITSFCGLPGVVDDPDLVLLLPHIAVLTAQQPEDDAGRQLVSDSYDCLSAITTLPGGAGVLVSSTHNITPLCQAVIGQSYGHERAIELLSYVCVTCGGDTWQKSTKYLTVLIHHITQELDTDQTERKFELCGFLGTVLMSCPQGELNKTEYSSWQKVIQKILFNILKNRLGSSQRISVLRLCSIITEQCSIHWVLESDCKFLLLLVHMACIEVRMALDTEDLNKLEGSSSLLATCYSVLEHVIGYMTAGPSLQLDSKQVTQLHSAMVGAFNAVICFLNRMSDHPQCQSMMPVVIASVRVLGSWIAEETSALREGIITLLPFLIQTGRDTLCECERRSVQNPDQDTKSRPSGATQLSGQHGTTDSTDTISHTHTETADSLSQSNSTATSHGDIPSQSSNLQGTGSGNSTGTADSSGSMSSISNQPSVSELQTFSSIEILQFLMPGFCHLSAEDASRKVMLTSDLPQILQHYMTYQFSRLERSQRSLGSQGSSVNKEPQVALLTTCGVLLNFVVLEGEMIADSQVFGEIVLLVVDKIIQLQERSYDNLSLLYNLMIVGLMIIRHRSVNTVKDLSETMLEKFFSGSIKLLKMMHHSGPAKVTSNHGNKASSNHSNIVLCYHDQWDEVAEYWGLCMQVMSVCSVRLHWFPSLVLASKWLPYICNMLFTVQEKSVPQDILMSYGELLIGLTKASPSTMIVIKEAGGLQLARKYKMKSLQSLF